MKALGTTLILTALALSLIGVPARAAGSGEHACLDAIMSDIERSYARADEISRRVDAMLVGTPHYLRGTGGRSERARAALPTALLPHAGAAQAGPAARI